MEETIKKLEDFIRLRLDPDLNKGPLETGEEIKDALVVATYMETVRKTIMILKLYS